MPIKDKSAYVDNWDDISYSIRLRAKDRCEQCRVENGALIYRLRSDKEQYVTDLEYKHMPSWKRHLYYAKPVRVVLTVSHTNHDTTDNSDGNLLCLCQLHHLRHDAAFHAQNAKKTRAAKKQAAIENSGQMELGL